MVLEMGATEMGGSGTSSVSTLFLLRLILVVLGWSVNPGDGLLPCCLGPNHPCILPSHAADLYVSTYRSIKAMQTYDNFTAT